MALKGTGNSVLEAANAKILRIQTDLMGHLGVAAK